MRRSIALLVVTMATQLGCPKGPPMRPAVSLEPDDSAPPVPARAPDAEPESESDPAVAKEMHERFEIVLQIQQAIVAGDLEGAQAQGVVLAGHLREGSSPTQWQPHLEGLRDELDRLEQAVDLHAAAGALARMGYGCGRCHEDNQVTLALSQEPAPQPGDDLEGSMLVHRWAVDRMWEGLVAPSRDRWTRGTTMFTVIPGCRETMAERGEEQRARCQHAQDLARRGHVTPEPSARAEIFGKLLTTCAQCHQGGDASGRP